MTPENLNFMFASMFSLLGELKAVTEDGMKYNTLVLFLFTEYCF